MKTIRFLSTPDRIEHQRVNDPTSENSTMLKARLSDGMHPSDGTVEVREPMGNKCALS